MGNIRKCIAHICKAPCHFLRKITAACRRPTSRMPSIDMSSPAGQALKDGFNVLYPVISAHWTHGEQVRWTLLSSFLTANTVLLLAWAAVFSSSSRCAVKDLRGVLASMCGAGCVLSIVYMGLACRVNKYIDMYLSDGVRMEIARFGPNIHQMPFYEKWRRSRGCCLIRTRGLCILVPVIFLLLYAVFFAASLRRSCSGHTHTTPALTVNAGGPQMPSQR